MFNENKKGFIGIEVVLISGIILGAGFLAVSSLGVDVTKLAGIQLDTLSTDKEVVVVPPDNPEQPVVDVLKVVYDENGYAKTLNVKSSDINSWNDFVIEATSTGSGLIIQDYLDLKDKTVVIPQLYTNGVPVVEIGASAFNGLTIHTVAIPKGVVTIRPSAFSYSSLVYMLIPHTVNTIEDYAFYSASKLKKVEFLGDVPSSLGNYIFSECGKLDPLDIIVPAAYLQHYKSHAAQFGVDASVFRSE